MVCIEYEVENIENIYSIDKNLRIKFGEPVKEAVKLGNNRFRLVDYHYNIYDIGDTIILVEIDTRDKREKIWIMGQEYKINETKANLEARLKIRLKNKK